MTREQLVECYDVVFSCVHSDGFKEAEIKDLLYDEDYRFGYKPKENWKSSLTLKLKEFGVEFPNHLSKTKK